jgi:hypothetical protein
MQGPSERAMGGMASDYLPYSVTEDSAFGLYNRQLDDPAQARQGDDWANAPSPSYTAKQSHTEIPLDAPPSSSNQIQIEAFTHSPRSAERLKEIAEAYLEKRSHQNLPQDLWEDISADPFTKEEFRTIASHLNAARIAGKLTSPQRKTLYNVIYFQSIEGRAVNKKAVKRYSLPEKGKLKNQKLRKTKAAIPGEGVIDFGAPSQGDQE